MPARALSGIAAAPALLSPPASAASRYPGLRSAATPPTAEPSSEASVTEFITTHTHTSAAAAGRFAWLLSDVVGTVILPEDERVPAAVLSGIGRPEVSPDSRHLSWWTNEARGVRQLHVF